MAAMFRNFPSTSDAFKNFPHRSTTDEGAIRSPPRKAARLDQNTHVSNVSSSRNQKGKATAVPPRGKGMTLNIRSSFDLRPELDGLFVILRRSVGSIMTPPEQANPITASFETIYMACKVLVVMADRGHDVYQSVKLELEKAIDKMVKVMKTPLEGVAWLDGFTTRMDWLHKRLSLLQSILVDLDQSYVLRHPELKPVKDLCLDIIRDSIYAHSGCSSKISSGIRQWALQERTEVLKDASGDTIMDDSPDANDAKQKSRSIVQRLISVLRIVGLFNSHFLTPFVSCTTDFYSKYAKETMEESETLSPTAYMVRCEKRLAEESQLVAELVDDNDGSFVIRAAELALMPRDLMRKLASPAVHDAMTGRRIPELARMYTLYKRIDNLDDLQVAFVARLQVRHPAPMSQEVVKDILKDNIAEIVRDVAKDDDMVTRLLDEKEFLDKILVVAFHERPSQSTVDQGGDIPDARAEDGDEDRPFSYAARGAFEKGFLARKRKPAEMIAKYVDLAMRKGQREESEDLFWKEIDNVLGLYRFTQDKDVFRTFYERALAKRLLLQRSASDALEERVINRLRDGYDPEFGKGNDMFKDIALSRDLLSEYRARNRAHQDKKMSVMVLKFSTWPFPKYEGTVNLPPQMSQALSSFTEFYKQKHKNHKLDWNHSLGTVTLMAQFDSGEKELSLSLYQAVVLLLFQDENKLCYQDILLQSGMKSADLIPTLQSLALGRTRVLAKRPPGKEVADTDEFLFNVKFDDRRHKLHIPSIQQQETVEETKRIELAIDLDRQASIDAAIVRIMKGHKKLMDEALKIKTIEVLRKHFVPAVQDIKKRIEHLLERDYM
ncbi:hypothetical protein FRB99_006104, partial [Tulasnella sp. 403]